ncbi:MAG: hypothetical protein HY329_03060 [Chloroflexi bacterium]|nr:hypothetical protein [Chloroflexota bacterium]
MRLPTARSALAQTRTYARRRLLAGRWWLGAALALGSLLGTLAGVAASSAGLAPGQVAAVVGVSVLTAALAVLFVSWEG